MRRRNQKAKFWTVLGMVNVLTLIYPINLYVQAADTGDAGFAILVLLGITFLLAIVDGVSTLVAYSPNLME